MNKKNKVSIIKNDEFIKAIMEAHDALSTDITDIYEKVSELYFKQDEAINYVKERFKKYAEISAKLSALLFEINSSTDLEKLSKEELNLLDHVREILHLAAKIQEKINTDILQKLKDINNRVQELSNSNIELVNQVMNLQDKSRVLKFITESMKDPSKSWYTNMLININALEKSNGREDNKDSNQ
ncbi:MAG: hypothetical protein KatS3mg085_522 [Candidatus Dojkabacteria bacterium]|nr:MAG: hypothetical protein KatS3mg085_522 [Candidatus Dojkabacteria bacterium]